jgi:phospholipid/cholesterol/gamma-HCH transport system substrate-binding protein
MRFFRNLRHAITGSTGRIGLRLVIYAGVCIVVLLYLVSLIGNVHYFEHTKGYKAELSDVTGLLQNDPVKIAGVAVGKVTGVHLDHGHALVTFRVRSNVRMVQGTKVAVRWRNLLGQKYLYLYPPTGAAAALTPGQRLPLRDELASADIGDFLNKVGPVLSAINPQQANQFVEALNQALDGNDARVRDLLSNAAQISTTVGGLDVQVGSVIDNLHAVLGALADRNQDLVATIDNLKNLSSTLADHNSTITTLLDQFTSLNEQVDALLNRNQSDFTQTIQNLQTVVNVLAQHHDDLDKGLATLPQGLLGYFRISRYGQWFQVRSMVTCIAGDSPAAVGVSQPCTRADQVSGALPGASAAAQRQSSQANLQALVKTVTGGAP